MALSNVILLSTLRRPSNAVLQAGIASVFLVWQLFQIGDASRALKATYTSSASGFASLDSINNATLGFEKIYVIGLPARTDRRDGMVLSAALSNMSIDLVDGVLGGTVSNKAIPVTEEHKRMPDPVIGCWRGHMNTIQDIVRLNISTALILEDDADWDVRIRDQLRDLALSVYALTQPLSQDPSSYADATFPTPKSPDALPASELLFDNLPSTVPPKYSPYGDNWDFLWVGHCGMRLPSQSVPLGDRIPKGRVVRHHDSTVPQKEHLSMVSPVDDLKNDYEEHTRVVSHVQDGICSLGYAITQAGARKLLHSIGLLEVNAAYDILLRQYCEGSNGRAYHNCLTVVPSLFHHHRPAGSLEAESDISDHGKGYKKTAHTDVVRWSTRMNWNVLLDGRTDFVDQWPDK